MSDHQIERAYGRLMDMDVGDCIIQRFSGYVFTKANEMVPERRFSLDEETMVLTRVA